MRKLSFAIIALLAFAFVRPAFAVVVDTETKVTNSGSEVPTATIKITQKDDTGHAIETDTMKVGRGQSKKTIKVDKSKTRKVEIRVTLKRGPETKPPRREEKPVPPEEQAPPEEKPIIVSLDEFLEGKIDLGHGLTLETTTRTAEAPLPRHRVPARPVPPAPPPVAPPAPPIWTGGLLLAGSVVFNSANLGITERDAETGETTFHSNESNGAVGGGVALSFAPGWSVAGVPLAPYVSADFLDQKVEHVFSGGSSLGERVEIVLDGGLQVPLWPLRPYLPSDLELYVVGGPALVEKQFQIFGSNSDQWLWGGTLGVGLLYRIPALWGGGVFAQYQHIWVERGDVHTPSTSPAFNYSFDNDMDLVKLGILVNLGGVVP